MNDPIPASYSSEGGLAPAGRDAVLLSEGVVRHSSAATWLLPWGLAAIVLFAGWWATWFLCDDAFIAFRYVGNAFDGHGLVWNPAPFAPVEGYSSFLWVIVLYLAWLVTGVAPSESSNPLALACGLLVLLLVARRLAVVRLPARVEPWRASLAALVLLSIASNHSFAMWTSSGLETAMFGLWAVGFTLVATASRQRWRARDLAALAVMAAMAALTRPDGALLVLGTLAIAAQRRVVGDLSSSATLRGLSPLVLPAAHLIWRHSYYGEWLPNTYYAKVTAAWPESGLRYLYCFVVEHGVWLAVPLVLVWAVVAGWRAGPMRALRSAGSLFGGRFPAAVAVVMWLGYIGYYTLVVGGDHFAYRIYAHLMPLWLLASFLLAASLRLPRALLVVWLVVQGVAANAFGWWSEAVLAGRNGEAYFAAAPRLPAAMRPFFVHYDRYRAWLFVRSVGMPRIVHANFCALVHAGLPHRGPGQVAGSRPGQRLVCSSHAVGVFGWALSDVAIIDAHGLNDWVVARTPTVAKEQAIDRTTLNGWFVRFDSDHDGRLSAAEIEAASNFLSSTGPALYPPSWAELLLALSDRDGDAGLDVNELDDAVGVLVPMRCMAHERQPPAGYLEALQRNVSAAGGHCRVLPEVVPLSDEEVRAVERRFREQVRR